MKKIISWLITFALIALLIFCYINREGVVKFVMGNIAQYQTVNTPKSNGYITDYDFEFVQTTDDFHVKSRQDILNVIYTVLNSGQTNFTFYCDTSYENCTDDLADISGDQILLSVINNMVSPYNSYEKLYITTNTYGKTDIEITKLYSDEDIKQINTKIEEIKNEVINDSMSDKEKIRAFHDYVINHSVYDEQRALAIEQGSTDNHEYNSHKANGPLLEGYALCSGYSDAMKIFLDELNIPNYKIANNNHIWNLLYIDGAWLHIDLTWDDPVTSDNSNLLLHKFFLITTDELLKQDTSSHSFEPSYYPEAA